MAGEKMSEFFQSKSSYIVFHLFQVYYTLIETSHFPRQRAPVSLSVGDVHTHEAGWSTGTTYDSNNISLFYLDTPSDLNLLDLVI